MAYACVIPPIIFFEVGISLEPRIKTEDKFLSGM